MIQVITREGDGAAVQTAYELTTLGSSGTMPRAQIEKGIKRIKKLIMTCGDGAGVATACGGPVFVRLSGATTYGKQEIVICGHGTLLTGNTSYCANFPPVELDEVNIALDEGKELIIECSQEGTDIGTPTFCVTAICDDVAAVERQYVSRYANCTTLDTDTAANLIPMTSTTGNITVPFSGKIERIITCYSNKLPLATAAGGTCFIELRNEGGYEGPGIFLPAGGMSSLATTTGPSGGYFAPVSYPFSRKCSQGGIINARGQQVGVDHGSANPAVTICFVKEGA